MKFHETSFVSTQSGEIHKIYSVSMKDAASVRKQLRQLVSVDNKSIMTEPIDIKTDKVGLCKFLNKGNSFIPLS